MENCITDLLSVVKNKLDFDAFCINYFQTIKQDGNFYHVKTKEKLNQSIAYDFYDEYVRTDLDFEEYQAQTSF